MLALLSLVGGLVYPVLQNQFARVRTMTSAKQIAAVIQRARLEAIRKNTTGSVQIVGRRVEANVAGTSFSGLLSDGVEFGAPSGLAVVDGFGDAKQASFTIAGGVEEMGAFRIVGPRSSYVEVRVEPAATARVEIRKWNGMKFKAQGEGGVAWTW